MRLRGALLALALLLHESSSSGDALKVCTTEEYGFNMLRSGVQREDVVSDTQLKGFDVDLRRRALGGVNYTLSMLDSYGEVHVRTRAGDCDIGWVQFFQTASRARCVYNAETCRDLNATTVDDMLSQAKSEGVNDTTLWEPFRCCADFSVSATPFDIRIMFMAAQGDFFYAIFNALADPFFVNLICFIVIWIIIFGHFIWLSERKENPEEFPPDYLDGIDDSVWWAAVTVTTVGYGDKVCTAESWVASPARRACCSPTASRLSALARGRRPKRLSAA